jgi:hypothetical protein
MPELTWADLDRLEAEREVKKRELIDRLTRLYAKNLSFDELLFCRGYSYGHIFTEAYEAARGQLEQKAR